MSFLLFEILWDWYTGVPILFSEAKMIRIYKVINFLFDSLCILRYVIFWEELLLLIIVDFIIFNGAYLRLSCFFGAEKFVQVLFLS